MSWSDLGADACRMMIEVTEHAAVDDYAGLAAAVQQLRHTGVRFAVDDAGAGYASMQHILRLRPDLIKLDRSIITGIERDPAGRALATAMAGFAASLGMTVVAEGVETADELAALTAVGITTAQGFHLARPAPLDGLLAGRAWSDVVRQGDASDLHSGRPDSVLGRS